MDATAAPVTQQFDQDFLIKLKVPAHSQIDPSKGFSTDLNRSVCGFVCLESCLEYYGWPAAAKALFAEIQERHGWDRPLGISHAAEVDVLGRRPLLAWRRNWEAPPNGPQWLVDHEGYTSEQVAALVNQETAEARFSGARSKQRWSILTSLDTKNPVIASMAPGFSANTQSHQIVVSGWQRQAGHELVEVMDPVLQPGHNLLTRPAEEFWAYFNQRAIFMRPR